MPEENKPTSPENQGGEMMKRILQTIREIIADPLTYREMSWIALLLSIIAFVCAVFSE